MNIELTDMEYLVIAKALNHRMKALVKEGHSPANDREVDLIGKITEKAMEAIASQVFSEPPDKVAPREFRYEIR